MRKLGTAALIEDETAAKLKLTDPQRKEIEKIVVEAKRTVTGLEKELSQGKPPEPLQQKFIQVKTDEQKRILKLLKPAQQTAWRDLVGSNFDMSRLGHAVFKAPDLVDTGEWINAASAPSPEQLRGKVVVVHFYAFGCINCIHNFPTYLEWQEEFKDKPVALIGIHTPETSAERESASVRSKAEAERFAFPVLIDGKKENWDAWGNSMWPSVYVIDKRGYLRQFWPGELKWQGATGDQHMREWVERLLAESGEAR
jgi:thiol-disulfide isomerase/thioredoxin